MAQRHRWPRKPFARSFAVGLATTPRQQSLHCALETVARLDGDRAAYEREYRLGPKDLCREDGAREPQGGPREAWGAKHRAKAGEAAQKHAGSRHENGAPSRLHRRRQPGSSLTPSESEEHLAIGAER